MKQVVVQVTVNLPEKGDALPFIVWRDETTEHGLALIIDKQGKYKMVIFNGLTSYVEITDPGRIAKEMFSAPDVEVDTTVVGVRP